MATTKPKFDRNPVLVTPPGVAGYTWLTRPDTKFDDDGIFKTNLSFDPEDKAFQVFKAKVEEIHKAAVATIKETGKKKVTVVSPFQMEEDEEGNETGRVFIKAKSKAKQKGKDGRSVDVRLDIVDAKRNKIGANTPVYGGSILKLAVRPQPYFMQGNCGITLYISGVQVIELQSGGDAASLFDDEDGYEADVADAADESFADEGDEDDDDLY